MRKSVQMLRLIAYRNTPYEKSKETMDSCLDSLHLISFDKLTCESAFYWRCYVFHNSEMVSEKDGFRWHSNKSYDATGAGLLPDLSVFCEYIKTWVVYRRVRLEFNCHHEVIEFRPPILQVLQHTGQRVWKRRRVEEERAGIHFDSANRTMQGVRLRRWSRKVNVDTFRLAKFHSLYKMFLILSWM